MNLDPSFANNTAASAVSHLLQVEGPNGTAEFKLVSSIELDAAPAEFSHYRGFHKENQVTTASVTGEVSVSFTMLAAVFDAYIEFITGGLNYGYCDIMHTIHDVYEDNGKTKRVSALGFKIKTAKSSTSADDTKPSEYNVSGTAMKARRDNLSPFTGVTTAASLSIAIAVENY